MKNKGRFKKGHIPYNKVSPKAKCIICGKTFITKPCHINKGHAKYCSMKCCGKSKIGKTKPSLMVKCIICGKKFKTYPSRIKRGAAKFCSRKCYRISKKGKAFYCRPKGTKSPNYKNGKFISKRGYIYVLKPNHPNKTKMGYVLEHRLVMEKHLNRYLKPKEVVHHINKNTSDNTISNLVLFPNQSAHRAFHGFHG